MDKTYYVITMGDYSDYHIVAVTEDKSKAEKISKMYSTEHGPCQIEEYKESEANTYPVWCVTFDSAGNVYEAFLDYNGEVWLKYCSSRQIYCRAKSQEAAIKIAAEKRAKYLAKKMKL